MIKRDKTSLYAFVNEDLPLSARNGGGSKIVYGKMQITLDRGRNI